jgi:hypothetical protein
MQWSEGDAVRLKVPLAFLTEPLAIPRAVS